MITAPETRRCPTCGTANKAFATFCYECGEPLDEELLEGGAVPAGSTPRQFRRWEVVAALTLIVGVLGFALVDWGQREAQAQVYRTGIAAISAQHWDAAAAAFGGLGTYRDAAQRRDEAAKAILIRDTTYIAGNEAAAAHDWITAYKALSQTVAIEPGYRNTQALYDTAVREAPLQALANTIVRRVSGGPPGLYLRRADGSEWRLAGSDAQSVVWTADARTGRILYDSPNPPGTPLVPPVGAPPGYSMIRQLPAGRRLQVADGGQPDLPPVVLPPQFGGGGYVLLGAQGVWSLDLGLIGVSQGWQYAQPTVGMLLNGMNYYEFASGVVSASTLAGSDTFLLHLDPTGQQLLLGQYDPAGVTEPHTRLYRLTDSTATLIGTIDGVVEEAELDPTGKALLYSVNIRNTLTQDRRVALIWQDLSQPETAARLILTKPFLGQPAQTDLPVGWLVTGTPPRVLVRLSTTAETSLILHDVLQGTDTTVWEPSGQANLSHYWLAPDGKTLFVEERSTGDDKTSTLVVQPLDPVAPPTRLAMPVKDATSYPIVLDALKSGTRVVVRVLYQPQQNNDGPVQTYDEGLYSIALNSGRSVAVSLGTQPIAITDILQGVAPQLPVLPSGVSGYRCSSGFRLRTLDGQATLPLVPGLNAIWTFAPSQSPLLWNR